MKCPKCNFKVMENAKFCLECGEKLSETSEEQVNEFEMSERTTSEANLQKNDTKNNLSKKVKIAIIIVATAVALVAIALLLVLVVFKHEHDWVYEITKEPTYTEDGEEYRSCEGCGTVEYSSIVPRLGISAMIDSISDAESCYQAAKVFYSLSENEQKKYSSRTWSLIEAMKLYSSDSRIRDMLMELEAQNASNYSHNRLRNKLLNIDSYKVNDQTTLVYYDKETNNYYLYINIDYSAQNKAGGYTRYENNANYCIWKNNSWSTLSYSSDEDTIKKIRTWQLDIYAGYNFTYNAK